MHCFEKTMYSFFKNKLSFSLIDKGVPYVAYFSILEQNFLIYIVNKKKPTGGLQLKF